MSDRKELIREYKETVRSAGIFQIRNKENGKCLVGSSLDLPSVLRRERFMLKLGSHRNKALSQDWQTFGPDAFEFEVVEELEPLDRPDYNPRDDLAELEALWLEKLQPFEPDGYNPRPRA